MAISVKQLHPMFVAEISGADPNDAASDADYADFQAALDEHAVLVFHGAPMSQERQVDFCGMFGTLEGAKRDKTILQGQERLKHTLADVSNVAPDNSLFGKDDRRRMFNLGNMLWHTDSSFKRVPAKYSMLHAHSVVPEGGETQIVDTRAAYEALPQSMKDRAEDLVAVHSILHSREKLGFYDFSEEERASLPPVHRPIVREHRESGRKALYLASHASHILGMEVPDGRMLISELLEHMTQREFVYTHNWQVGDIVFWDNRCTLHRGRPYDDVNHRRDMRRATIEDDDPAMEHRDAA
ncbi:MAG: TauD/TfdA family dioxygenase [Pseudomonadota bacterium]